MRKLIIISSSILLLSACGLQKNGDTLTPVTVHNDSQGNVMQVTAQLTQDNATEVLTSRTSAQENQGYFMAQQALYSNPNVTGSDLVAMEAVKALGGGKTTPTNSNDVKLAELQLQAQKNANMWGFLKFGTGAIVADSLGGDLINALSAGAAGVKVLGNNNQVRGVNTGNKNTDSGVYREEIGGVPLEPGQLSPVALGTQSPEGEEIQGEIAESGSCSCPPGYNIRPGTTDICSDGSGGSMPASCPIE